MVRELDRNSQIAEGDIGVDPGRTAGRQIGGEYTRAEQKHRDDRPGRNLIRHHVGEPLFDHARRYRRHRPTAQQTNQQDVNGLVDDEFDDPSSGGT